MYRREQIEAEIEAHLEKIKELRKLLSEEEEQLQICYNVLNVEDKIQEKNN